MAFLRIVGEGLQPNLKDIRGDFKDYLPKLVQSCWQAEYKQRPTFDKIVIALRNETF